MCVVSHHGKTTRQRTYLPREKQINANFLKYFFHETTQKHTYRPMVGPQEPKVKSFRHTMDLALVNSQQLWLPAQGLYKAKPVHIPEQMQSQAQLRTAGN